MTPEIRYAVRDGVRLAYQTLGSGLTDSLDVVLLPDWVSHLDYQWNEPLLARALRRLGASARLTTYDRRGTGLSERAVDLDTVTLDEEVADLEAVLDAAGVTTATLLAPGAGGPRAIAFAAAHPDRVGALILFGTAAQPAHGNDEVDAVWASGEELPVVAPGVAGDRAFARWWTGLQRSSATPAAAAALRRADLAADVTALLPVVQAPATVVHRRGDRCVPLEAGRHLAAALPGARLVEVEGNDHLWWIGNLQWLDSVVAGSRAGADDTDRGLDRVLATVLFTDLVGSTDELARVGDERWRDLIDRHDDVLRAEVGRFGGRALQSTGDGYFCAFDTPSFALDCAHSLHAAVVELGLRMRAGIHTGECVVRENTLGGIAVHIGSRVCAAAGPGDVLVSSTVRELAAGSGYRFEPRGERTLKGVPGRWALYRATPPPAPVEPVAPAPEPVAAPRPAEVGARVDRQWFRWPVVLLPVAALVLVAALGIRLASGGGGESSSDEPSPPPPGDRIELASAPAPPVRWKADTGSYIGAPVVADDEHVFVPTSDGISIRSTGNGAAVGVLDVTLGDLEPVLDGETLLAVDANGVLRAIDTTSGEPRWSARVAGAAVVPGAGFTSAPTVADGTVYVGTADGLDRYELDTGERLEPIAIDGDEVIRPVVADGVIVVAASDDDVPSAVYSFDVETLGENWRQQLEGQPITLAVVDDAVYVVEGSAVSVYTLGSGIRSWRTDLGDFSDTTPLAVGGRIYLGTDSGNLHVLDAATGTPEWFVPRPGGVDAAPIVHGGAVVFGNESPEGEEIGGVQAVDPATGAAVWRLETGSVRFRAYSAGEVLYVVDGGILYALVP